MEDGQTNIYNIHFGLEISVFVAWEDSAKNSQMSAGKRLRLFVGGRGRGDTSSTGPEDTSCTAPGGSSGSAHVPSPVIQRPQREGRARDRLVTASARRKETHLRDEDMDV